MNMNKFKNNKIVILIGQLIPLLGILLFMVDHNAGVFYSVFIGIYYAILIFITFLINKVNVLMIGSRKIYSEYGTYYLIPDTSIEDYKPYTYYAIYTNKYWIFLSKVNDGSLHYSGDNESFKKNINIHLENALGDILKERRRKSSLNKWNGAVDEYSNREVNINKALN